MPLGLDQGIGAIVWSPLGWGRLTGKLRRGKPLPPPPAASTPKSPSTWARHARRPNTSTGSSMPSMKWPKRPAKPCPRSPSTGCCSCFHRCLALIISTLHRRATQGQPRRRRLHPSPQPRGHARLDKADAASRCFTPTGTNPASPSEIRPQCNADVPSAFSIGLATYKLPAWRSSASTTFSLPLSRWIR